MVGLWLLGLMEALGGGGCMEGNGLSGGLHIWEPLTHSCLLSACLWMNLDGTERDGAREGGAGRVIRTGGNPDGSRRLLLPSGREGS